MESLGNALVLLADPATLAAIVAGIVFGMIVGAMPGLGSVLAITIALPFTFGMDKVPSIALVLAIYCASVYGGSLSAILINTPGTPQSAATVLDGFPMTRQGKADLALGWATMASLIGGLFSAAVLIVAAPQLARFALRFGAIETFALIGMALTCIAGVSRGSMFKGLLAGVLGLFLATVGTDPMTGSVRFDFGIFELSGGFKLIPVVVGLFAFAEVFSRIAERRTELHDVTAAVGFKLAPLAEWLARWKTIVRSAVIGTFIGVLPGTGAATASFIAYSEAKRVGRFRERLGTGEPEGVVASETANNAVTGGALVPTLALGIPGDPVTAVMMSALIIQGIQPGVRLFVDNPDVMNAAFMALIVCNLLMFAVGALAAPIITRVLRMPESILLAMVLVLSVVGSYGVSGRMFDVMVSVVFGIVGYLFRICNVPTAPVVIGMVLGPIFEESLRQGLILTDGDFLAFFGPEHPIAMVLLVITVLIVVIPIWRHLRARSSGPSAQAGR
ncbi:MAG: tripartite tricarboxylate transporter permease [Ectothiorhodospiraceae bacterium]|nr:tripartite tricarboxylate transporter permease [Chromatiales bacterium]MCP5154935.1 tripartite tricarboxylate transporter permease [Ectothiorhodospiraceae bacterium]